MTLNNPRSRNHEKYSIFFIFKTLFVARCLKFSFWMLYAGKRLKHWTALNGIEHFSVNGVEKSETVWNRSTIVIAMQLRSNRLWRHPMTANMSHIHWPWIAYQGWSHCDISMISMIIQHYHRNPMIGMIGSTSCRLILEHDYRAEITFEMISVILVARNISMEVNNF